MLYKKKINDYFFLTVPYIVVKVMLSKYIYIMLKSDHKNIKTHDCDFVKLYVLRMFKYNFKHTRQWKTFYAKIKYSITKRNEI